MGTVSRYIKLPTARATSHRRLSRLKAAEQVGDEDGGLVVVAAEDIVGAAIGER
jgi:hypothetical protein